MHASPTRARARERERERERERDGLRWEVNTFSLIHLLDKFPEVSSHLPTSVL